LWIALDIIIWQGVRTLNWCGNVPSFVSGTLKASFPKLMGEIQAQVVAADINDDGILEIVSADVRGNVAAWTRDGKELWTVHLKSLIAQVLLSVQLLLNSLYLVFASRQIEYL
jgi:hypothetical protein